MINTDNVIYAGSWLHVKRNIVSILTDAIESNSEFTKKEFIDVVTEIAERLIAEEILYYLGVNQRVATHRDPEGFTKYVLNIFRIYNDRHFVIRPQTELDSVGHAVETIFRCFILEDDTIELTKAMKLFIYDVTHAIDKELEIVIEDELSKVRDSLDSWKVYGVKLPTHNGLVVINVIDDFRILDWHYSNEEPPTKESDSSNTTQSGSNINRFVLRITKGKQKTEGVLRTPIPSCADYCGTTKGNSKLGYVCPVCETEVKKKE